MGKLPRRPNMTKRNCCVAWLALLLFFTTRGYSQEVQIPVDQEGKLEYIDAQLEQRLSLFPDYLNFQEARMFKVSDTLYVLEVYYRPQDALFKERMPLSADQVNDFRQKVSERLRQRAPQVTLDQSGRTRLIISNLALSLAYYGWAVPTALDTDNGKTAVALYMLTSGAGFFIPYSATRNNSVSGAAAKFSFYGGTRGIAHGITLAYLLDNEPSEQGTIGAGMLVSLVENVVGFSMAKSTNMGAGTAETIGVGGDFGIGLGLGAAHLANFFEEDNERAAAAATLLGTGIGLLGGSWMANSQHYTEGDAFTLCAAGFLGALVPLAAVDVAKPDDERVYSAASMIGGVVGLGLGQKLIRGKDFSKEQGNLIRFGELAGGLLGLGVAYLISSEGADNSLLYLTASSAGAATGFGLMYGAYAKKASSSFMGKIRIMPEGLLTLAMRDRMTNAGQAPLPWVQVIYEF